MKALAGLAFLLCSAPLATQALAQDVAAADTIAPSLLEHVNYIESHIKLPPEAGLLESYDRYYAFDTDIPNSVAGYYISRGDFPDYKAHSENPVPGVYLVLYKDLPYIVDGRCRTNISIGYSIDSREITYACREHMPPSPPPPPPWPKPPH